MPEAERMVVLRCPACGRLHIPPAHLCSHCGQESLAEYPLSGTGKVYTFTTIFVAPAAFKDQAPYDIALVELAEGLRVTARVKRGKGKLEIGAPVRFIKKDETGHWFQTEG